MQVHFSGERVRGRRVVVIGKSRLLLQPKSFYYLFYLAGARIVSSISSDGGWINKDDIEPGLNQNKYIAQLRNELTTHFDADVRGLADCIQNDHRRRYRLDIAPESISADIGGLATDDDHSVAALAKLMAERSAGKEGA